MRRFDYERAVGWQVVIPASASKSGARVTAYFADMRLGGSAKAYAAAVKFRNQHIATKRLLKVASIPKSKDSRNVSGVIGVSLDYGRNGHPYAWLSRWQNAPGEQVVKQFSIERYGYQQAFELAVMLRARKTGILPVFREAPQPRAMEKRRAAIRSKRAANSENRRD